MKKSIIGVVLFVIICLAGIFVFFCFSKNKIVIWNGPYTSLTIFNETQEKQEVKILINKTVLFGSFNNLEELLGYILAGVESDEEILKTLYEFIDSKKEHFCSPGSPYEEVRKDDNIMRRLFSYAFACCSDINPMLAYFYQILGYKATVISNPQHVILIANTGIQDFVVDADLHVFIKSSFEEAKKLAFTFQEIDQKTQEKYRSIFIEGEASTSFYSPGNYEQMQLPTEFPVYLYPEEKISFKNKWNGERVVSYPSVSKDEIETNHWDESIFSSLGSGTLYHHLSEHIVSEENGCRIYNLESPYVILNAEIYNLNTESLSKFEFSKDQANWWAIDLRQSDFIIDYKLFQEGQKELILDPIRFLDGWGGYGYRVYMGDVATVNRLMADKLENYNFILYEDGIALPYPNEDSNTILGKGEGRYLFYEIEGENLLLFSASDNSDPRTNGREYKIQFTSYKTFDEPFGRYNYYLKACPNVEGDFSFEDSVQLNTSFQYNRLMLPQEIQTIEKLTPGLTVTLTK